MISLHINFYYEASLLQKANNSISHHPPFLFPIKCTSSEQPSHLTTRTQRSVETADAVHILSILGLLLLANPVHIIAGNFFVLGALERHEAHHLPHQSDFRIRVEIHGRRFGGRRDFSGRRFIFAGFTRRCGRVGGAVHARVWDRGSRTNWSRGRQVLRRRVFVRGGRWWRFRRRAFGAGVRNRIWSCGFWKLRSSSRASSCGRELGASWRARSRAMAIGATGGWIIC